MSVDTSALGTAYGTEETETAFDEAFEETDSDDEFETSPATLKSWFIC